MMKRISENEVGIDKESVGTKNVIYLRNEVLLFDFSESQTKATVCV